VAIETELFEVQAHDLKMHQYLPIISEAASHTFNESNLNIKPRNGATVEKYTGKVRDRYNDGVNVTLVTTDRLTAFDRKVTNIPFKGAVLNLVSKYWFEKTQHIMPNHFISTPHPNVTIGKAVTPIPIEFVVREYLTGTTDTSILTHYQKGVRDYCGNKLPDGLRKHEKLAAPIVTPTTKSDAHDQLISPQEIVAQGIMTQQEWDYCASKAIELFNFASQEAAKRGLILVDTKMEMGRTADGQIILIDELFTPDSSRYWLTAGYAEAFAKGDSPKNIDKEYVRKWINANCDPYQVAELPKVPLDVVAELSRRYVLLYELITGLDFPFNEVLAAQDVNAAVQKVLDALNEPAVLGILGGGQLGRMLALSAANMGIPVKILETTGAKAPAAVAAVGVSGNIKNAQDVQNFAAQVDVLTVEIEHVNAKSLIDLEAQGICSVQPSGSTVAVIQDKFTQKNHFKNVGIALGDFCEVTDAAALEFAATKYSYPFMLKSKRLAYDGRGNFVVHDAAEHELAVAKLGGYERGLYAEKWQSFSKELAVMVVRSTNGEVKLYPVTETIQKDSICYITETPAQITTAQRIAAENLALQAVASLDGAGVFGVEMFLLPDGSVLLNEVAPRVHNSGHYTINGCVTSQFENHVRAVMDYKLGDTSLTSQHVIMLNIIGTADGDAGMQIAQELMDRAYNTPGCNVHWYNKDGVKTGRKMGHINIVGKTIQEARARLEMLDPAAAACLTSKPKPRVGIIMGSDSDLPTMKDAAIVLDELGIEYEITLVSAHRTPQRLEEYARSARDRGLQVIIAGAGGAAHLPGMVASMTTLPVIGVPVVPPTAAYLNGVDALYSILQMPAGIPVATVAIGNATNGGLLAARILAATDAGLTNKLLARQEAMRDKVLEKAAALEQKGWKETLQPTAKKAPEMLSQFANNTTPVVPVKPETAEEKVVPLFKP
jgi:phosphoribosylaminoimidazole carboxylase